MLYMIATKLGLETTVRFSQTVLRASDVFYALVDAVNVWDSDGALRNDYGGSAYLAYLNFKVEELLTSVYNKDMKALIELSKTIAAYG